MNKLAWISDVHLNFLARDDLCRLKFYKTLTDYDAVVISGDIAEGGDVHLYLNEMGRYTKKPIYYVCGNHDYYGKSFVAVERKLKNLESKYPNLYYLAMTEAQKLSDGVYITGVDGWYDSNNGDYKNSQLQMTDFRLIKDYEPAVTKRIYTMQIYWEGLRKIILRKAKKDRRMLSLKLTRLISLGEVGEIVIVLHVPPFVQNSLYGGKIASDDFLPFYTSKIMGSLLTKFAKKYNNIQFTVLCGHSHHGAYFSPLENLRVYTAGAKYSNPAIAGIVHINDGSVRIDHTSIALDGR